MDNIRLLLLIGVAVLMHGCGPHKVQECKADVTESEKSTEECSCFRSYEIGKDEVRDTSFTLPRKLLDDPMAFMKALTDVQMINREWTDTYNYTEKLLFGDSILREFCSIIASSNNVPVYLTDEISDEENFEYHLTLRKWEDKSFIFYNLKQELVEETTWVMSEKYRELLDNWDKKEMFTIGGTDEHMKKYMMSSGMVIYAERAGKISGSVTRLRCNNDSVYVDMLKLYLWALEEIPDEAEVMEMLKRKEERMLRKQMKTD